MVKEILYSWLIDMYDIKRVTKIFKEILVEQERRNQIIKESAERDFAFSDDELYDNTIEICFIRLGKAAVDDIFLSMKGGG